MSTTERPLRIRAALLREGRTPLEVCELLLDPPGPHELRVRVAAAGVCHSDLHVSEGHLGEGRWPIVLGHEGAGVVEAVGDGVTHVAPGDRVAFCFVPPCHACPACAAGRFHLCETAASCGAAGTMFDGTTRLHLPDGRSVRHFNFVSCFAERCVVPAAAAIPLPSGLPLWQAALLGCGVVTGMGAVRNAARVRLGESVAVVGCGGVGLQVVAAAHVAGAGRIVAVDRQPDNLRRAGARGATHLVDARDGDPAAAVLAAVPGGVDHAFEVVGLPSTIRLAWDVLRPGATARVLGIVPAGVEVSLPGLELLSEKGLKGCYYGSSNVAAELPGLVELAVAGRLALGDVVSHVTDLDGVEEAFERLRRGEGARTVVLLDADAAGALDDPSPGQL